MNIDQTIKSGDEATILQAARDNKIEIHHHNNHIVISSTEEVSKQIMQTVFGELPIETKAQITENQKSYTQILIEKLQRITVKQDELLKVVYSPDFQFISKKAAISASRNSDKNLHKNLASLIVQRINCDNDDLKRIVYNEAIETVEKITKDQLKIITVSFLIKRTHRSDIKHLQQLIIYFEKIISPFLSFKKTTAEFEHLQYAGCASINFMSFDLLRHLKHSYPEVNYIDNLVQASPSTKKLLELAQESPILRLDLTSVGIVLAANFFEQITGEKIEINHWIN